MLNGVQISQTDLCLMEINYHKIVVFFVFHKGF